MPKAKGKASKKFVAEKVGAAEVVGVETNGFKVVVSDALANTVHANGADEVEASVTAVSGKGGRGRKAGSKAVKEELPITKAVVKGRGKLKKPAESEVIAKLDDENVQTNGVVSVSVEEELQEAVAAPGKSIVKGRRGAKGVAAKENGMENGDAKEIENAESDKEKQEVVKTVKARGGKRTAKEKTDDLKGADDELYATKTAEAEVIVPAKKVAGRKKKADDKATENAFENAATSTFDLLKGDKFVKDNEDLTNKKEQGANPVTLSAETKNIAKKQTERKKNIEKKGVTEVISGKEANEKTLFDILKEETDITKNSDTIAQEAKTGEKTIAVVESNAKQTIKKSGGRKKKADDKTATDTVGENVNNGDNEKDLSQEDEEPPKKKGRGKKAATAVIKHVEEEISISEDTQAQENVEEQKKSEKRGNKQDVVKPAAKRGIKSQAQPQVEKNEEVKNKSGKRGRGAVPKTATATSAIDEVTHVTAQEDDVPKKRSRNAASVDKDIKSEIDKPKKAGRAAVGKRKAAKLEVENVETSTQMGEDASLVYEVAAEATEDSLSTIKSEKVTPNRGGRKRAAPATNKSKAGAADVDERIKVDAVTAEATKVEQNNDDEADDAKSSKAKKRKKESAPMNATSTLYSKEDFQLPPLAAGEKADEPRYNLKISSWNVAGLRAWIKKEGLRFLEYEEPDIFCLQETKCVVDQMPEEVARIPGYHPYWLCMPGGYAGVAVYSKIMPINVEYGIGHKDFDDVGRVITAEYEKFFLINAYVPNSGRKLVNLDARMQWEKLFQEFVQKYNARKPVVICGDMNVSHQEIDLANPKTNTRNAGFTKEERDKMTELLSLGYVDTFRHLYPDRKGAYTFWTYMGNARSRNVGWRLDYFIVSERFVKRVVDNCMRSQCMGSDHCPITLFLKL